MIVSAWTGFIAGTILGIARFISMQSLWTFLNIIVEPLDSILIALAAGYVAYVLTVRKQIINQ